MPDENDNSSSSFEEVPPSEAEPIINKVNGSVCARCGESATSFCPSCGQDFCAKHRCLTHANTEGFEVSRDPLTDEDGTEHRGRRIRLIGEGWPDHIRMLSTMSDEELVTQLAGLQTLLKDAIAAQDFARICIAHAEYELDYRRHSRHVAAMKRREKIEQGAVRLGKKRIKARVVETAPDGSPIPPDIVSLMDGFKLSYQQALAMKILLGGAKKA